MSDKPIHVKVVIDAEVDPTNWKPTYSVDVITSDEIEPGVIVAIAVDGARGLIDNLLTQFPELKEGK